MTLPASDRPKGGMDQIREALDRVRYEAEVGKVRAEVEALKREREEAQETEHQVRESFVQERAARQTAEEERDRLLLKSREPGSPWQGEKAELKGWKERAEKAEATIARMERYMRHYIGAEADTIADSHKGGPTDLEAALSEEAGACKDSRCPKCREANLPPDYCDHCLHGVYVGGICETCAAEEAGVGREKPQ